MMGISAFAQFAFDQFPGQLVGAEVLTFQVEMGNTFLKTIMEAY